MNISTKEQDAKPSFARRRVEYWRQKRRRGLGNADEPENRVEGEKRTRAATATQRERVDELLATKDLSGLFDGMDDAEARFEIKNAQVLGQFTFDKVNGLIRRLETMPNLNQRSPRDDSSQEIRQLDGLGGSVSYPKRSIGRFFARFSNPEIRLLHAAYASLFYINGVDLYGPYVEAPMDLVCDAAGLPNTAKNRQRLLKTADDVSDKVFRWLEPYGEHGVIRRSRQLVVLEPFWYRRADEGHRPADGLRFYLPREPDEPVARLCLKRSVLDALGEGSKAIRSPRHGFTGLDWALFLEITQTFQYGQRGPNGVPESFVERKDFIVDAFGREAVKKRRSNRNHHRLEKRYLQTVEVLRAGGLILSTDLGRECQRGLRDVFEVNPDFVTNRALRNAVEPASVE